MSGLFQNKYKIESIRLPKFDYSSNGMYFVTICTNERKLFFGKIENEKMILNKIGQLANEFWLQIPKHFSGVYLDEYIIMPNHLHGIIEIRWSNNVNDAIGRDEAMPRLYQGKYPHMSKISPKPKSLPVIIGSFKSISTKTINQKFPRLYFSWQPRYYDHIIRNEKSLENIRNYILNNPYNWPQDRNNPLNFLNLIK